MGSESTAFSMSFHIEGVIISVMTRFIDLLLENITTPNLPTSPSQP